MPGVKRAPRKAAPNKKPTQRNRLPKQPSVQQELPAVSALANGQAHGEAVPDKKPRKPSKVANCAAKGSKLANAVSKKFAAQYGQPFHSTPGSGSLRWAGEVWTYGDIVPPEGLDIVVECKDWDDDSKLNCENIINPLKENQKHMLRHFWDKVEIDRKKAEKVYKRPFASAVVFKRSRAPQRIMVSYELWEKMAALIREQTKNNEKQLDILDHPHLIMCFDGDCWVVMVDLDHFLSIVHLAWMHFAAKELKKK